MSHDSRGDDERRARLAAELASVQRKIEELYESRDESGMSAAQTEQYVALLAAERRLRDELGISAKTAMPNRPECEGEG